VPKIISERCELVKLCHINPSGPVFFDTRCIMISRQLVYTGDCSAMSNVLRSPMLGYLSGVCPSVYRTAVNVTAVSVATSTRTGNWNY